MKLCPRCRVRVEGRTCKRCGAFVEGADGPLAEEPASGGAEPREEPADSRGSELPSVATTAQPDATVPPGSWRCPRCSEQIEAAFVACWQCGTEKGTPAEAVRAAEERAREEASRSDAAGKKALPPPLACARCGSNRVIPDQLVEDQDHHTAGELHTVVYARPEAWIFKDALRGRLLADICGDCGHVALHVDNPGELYEHYRRSRRS